VKVTRGVVVFVCRGDKHHNFVKVFSASFISLCQVNLFRVVGNNALREPLARPVRMKNTRHARVISRDALVVSVLSVVSHGVRITVVYMETLSSPWLPGVRDFAPRKWKFTHSSFYNH
jgi:hypothetical protein